MLVPIVGMLVAVWLLPPLWGIVLLSATIVWEVAEKLFWLRWVRRYPVAVGRETLIGAAVTAATACRPDGRVRLNGETWKARCAAGARLGERLVVQDVDRITLIVAPPSAAS